MKNTLKPIFYFLVIIVFNNCASNAQNENLKRTIDSLQQKNNLLERKLAEATLKKTHSNVVLANTEVKKITSSSNGQTYTIKIKLPREYSKNSTSYPVLYVTDAETNFGGVCYIVQRLIKDKLIPPMIIVGIAYDTDYKSFYQLRSRDLTPVEDKNLTIGGSIDPTGGAPLFSKFLEQELFPFIEKNYNVQKNERTYYGHSYGGLFGTYVLINNPELFNKYLILSPSLWFYNRLMLKQVTELSPDFGSGVKLYMASGELEQGINRLQTIFISKIKNNHFDKLTYKAEVLKNETHRTIFGAGFTNGLRYLFE
ncbi:alpha/beta hydrolase [Tenacibaculum sp. TC6]|uniref:alpha/beta hydrolase n=1 Tax=Tenacibaculum sp. TC6 TaxID=3423223 RepID=UPI003D3699F1